MTQQKEVVRQTQTSQATRANSYKSVRPKVDIFEDSNGITLVADIPGVAKERLDIEIDNEILSIDGEVQLPLPDSIKEGNAGLHASRYQRSFSLSKELDGEQIDASLNDGVLVMKIPKRQEFKAKKIEIRTT
ncbi:MAG: Hsp20/alpha crystallin family protein [Candidatus Thiodiazotropha sp. 6PLUC3]